MVRRPSILALAALVAGTGCHAGLSGNTARQEPALPRETVTVQKFIEQHNKNASTVRSLTARPQIQLVDDRERKVRVNGLMALERPRGFRLEIKGPAYSGEVADLGSNDKEFWFWVKDNPDKEIFFCDYKDVNASQLAITYQPDWIIEAMGLRVIEPREAATIAVTRIPNSKDLILLTQRRKDNKGEMLVKETVVDETNGHIREHRLYAGAKKELLARATVTKYFGQKLDPTGDDPAGALLELPEKITLRWEVEKFSLDITMAQVKINPEFPEVQRAALFTEPKIQGTRRQDLAQLSGPAANASKVYETMPSPPARSDVRLGQPEPMEVEGGLRTRSEPQPLSANVATNPAPPRTEVIGAPMPRGSDPEAYQASGTRSSWRPRPAILDR